MSLFADMLNDTIYLVKKDGTRLGPSKGLYGKGRIMVGNPKLVVEDGDTIIRMAGANEEFYTVTDCGYSPGHPGAMEPFYNPFVRKSTAPKTAPRTVNFHTQVHGPTGVQIGNRNQIEVKTAIDVLTQTIEASSATAEQKAEAKGALAKFFSLPAVQATIGTLFSAGVEGVTKVVSS